MAKAVPTHRALSALSCEYEESKPLDSYTGMINISQSYGRWLS